MEELQNMIRDSLNDSLNQIVLSNSRRKEDGIKAKIRPVLIKNQVMFQETLYRGTQVFHDNFTAEQMETRLLEYIRNLFRQAQIRTMSREITVLVGKKGTVTIKSRLVNTKEEIPAGQRIKEHNRKKNYVLEDGIPVDFLIELGVQTQDGRVVKSKYDKFRQINKYLEFIEDILDELPRDRTIRIIDFGCGKSYLTFAMYYYLHQLQKRDIRVTGLDLKKQVIEECSMLARKLHYDGLEFLQGDIQNYDGTNSVDMVVTLHACDKATDYALEKAVNWGAAVILAVPCCQHELNQQITCDMLKPILRYGLIKERMSALITDALRANILEQNGYRTQILEFIDMEHTPKNLMIRAIKTNALKPAGRAAAVEQMEEFLHVAPTLEKLLPTKKGLTTIDE